MRAFLEQQGGLPVSKKDISPRLKEIIEATAKEVVQQMSAYPPAAVSSGSRLLTVKETRSYLSCSRSTLTRLEEKSVLVPRRFGRKVLYDRADLDSYIQKAGVP